MKTQKTFYVEVEKALDWNEGYLNWNNKLVEDINDAQAFDDEEEAEEAAATFNLQYGRQGRIYARVQ